MSQAIEVRSPSSNRTRSSNLLKGYAALIALAAAVVATDQWVKALVIARLASGNVVSLFGGFLHLDYTWNTGAAFGFGRSAGGFFAVAAVVVCLGIVLSFRRVVASPLLVRLALGLILGGAIGNLIDRLRLGHVVDFIDLRWWPVFNLADSAIVCGVVLLCFHSLLSSAQPRK